MNTGEQQYLDLVKDVLANGTKKSIYGVENKYILSVFGRLLRFSLSNNTIPILTTKKLFWKGAFKEILWFLSGSNNVAELAKQKVNIWNEFAYKYFKQNYIDDGSTLEEFVEEILLKREVFTIPTHYSNSTKWKFNSGYLDQTKWVIDSIKKNPDRKSYVISYWNPEEVYSMADECGKESVLLPACGFTYTVNISNNKLSLSVKFRSSDIGTGLGFNIAQYGLLTYMYSKCCNYEPGELVVMLDDAHIYSDQIEPLQQQLERTPSDFPQLNIKDSGQKYLTDFVFEDFEIINYNPEKAITVPLTIVGGYDKVN